MKQTKLFLILATLMVLASCAPRAVPAAPEIMYATPSNAVFGAVVRAISTSPGLDGSNGWIIDQSDSAGGFVSASTTTNGWRLGEGFTRISHSVSVVVSPNGPERTAVVVQFTPEANQSARRIRLALTNNLEAQFLDNQLS